MNSLVLSLDAFANEQFCRANSTFPLWASFLRRDNVFLITRTSTLKLGLEIISGESPTDSPLMNFSQSYKRTPDCMQYKYTLTIYNVIQCFETTSPE